MGRPVPIRAGVGASIPAGGRGLRLRAHWGLSARPLHPFGSPPEAIERPMGRPVPIRAGVGASFPTKGNFFGKVVACCCKQGGFPRGKQSARPALPCAPLVVCLNSGALTACGGCIHWIPASLRSPLHPLRIANRNNRAPHRAASSSPAPESARQTPPGAGDCACGHSPANTGASPCKPLPFKEASP